MYATVTNTSARLSVYDWPISSVHRKATTRYALMTAVGMLRQANPRPAALRVPPVSTSAVSVVVFWLALFLDCRRAREHLASAHAANWQTATSPMKAATSHHSCSGYASSRA